MTDKTDIFDATYTRAPSTAAMCGDVLDILGQVLAWAEVGIQSAPRGKTVPDLNWCGIQLRAHLTTKPNQDDLRKVREALIAYRDNAAVKHPQVAQRGEEAMTIIDRIIGGE